MSLNESHLEYWRLHPIRVDSYPYSRSTNLMAFRPPCQILKVFSLQSNSLVFGPLTP